MNRNVVHLSWLRFKLLPDTIFFYQLAQSLKAIMNFHSFEKNYFADKPCHKLG